ncbi:MAG: MBL fold metallo-hydrolase, partial [Blastocatellia bacterium]
MDQWPDNALTLENLGHATLLMNFFGVRVISDPTLFNRVGVSLDSILTIGPRRLVAPVLPPDRLQTVKVILITHAHMDHLDLPSLKALP